MKSTLTLLLFFLFASHLFAQSPAEAAILKVSNQVFNWEVTAEIDSLESVFDEKFVVVDGTGKSQTKKEYIARLRSGNFIHNRISVKENTATVANNTATVVGTGTFTVTASGKKISLRLSYIEVFTRPNLEKPWTILAMHATVL